MQNDPESPFELLEPPPGGVERMRQRLAAPEPVQNRFGIAAAGIAVLTVLIALLARAPNEWHGRDANSPILAAPELDRLLGREAQPVPLTVERDGQQQQIEQLPSSDPRVRIYRTL
jgi:hypothetical protein